MPRSSRTLARGTTLSGVAAALVACVASAQPTTPTTAPALFAYDTRAPLDLRDSVARTTDSLVIHRVSFASPKGGRATGWLYVPTAVPRGPGGRYAGVVVLHGAPGDAAGMGFVSEPVARAGAVVLTIDAPFARRDPGKPLSFTPQDSADVVQYVVDLQRAVDVLAARPDVDPARLGAVGVSYGGTIGALLAGVERRLTAYVLAVADGGLDEHFSDLAGRRRPAPPGLTEAQWRAWNDAMAPVASLRFVGRAAPARLLFLWGREDTFVPPEHALALWRAALAASRDSIWYASGHALPPASGDDQRQWLADRLGMAPPPVFVGPAAAYVGTYSGWGPMGRAPLDVRVVVDARGRLAMRGPLTGPDDPEGRLTYVGRTQDGETFRFWDKRLTFVRTGARVTALHVDARMDTTPVHIVLTRQTDSVPNAAPSGDTAAWSVDRAVLRTNSVPAPARLDLVRGIAVRRGPTVRDGTIEFDLAAPEGRGTQFAGITFRMASTADYEVVYFQSTEDGTRWSIVQYQPVFEGETTWQLYPGDGYEARLPRPDDARGAGAGGRPLHVRLVVAGTRADLYVDSARTPVLRVRELKRDGTAGAVGVWAISPEGAAAGFENVAVRATVDEPPAPVAAAETPPGQIVRWRVSPRLPSPDGVAPPRALSRGLRASLAEGCVVDAEAGGLVNLTRALGNPAGRQATNVFGGAGWGMALARVVLTSDRPRVVRLRFGYSDGVGVFLDGQSLFVGRNDYDSRYKGDIATMSPDAEALDLPLHAGRNELVLAVTDKAFGWGFAARLEHAAGVAATP